MMDVTLGFGVGGGVGTRTAELLLRANADGNLVDENRPAEAENFKRARATTKTHVGVPLG